MEPVISYKCGNVSQNSYVESYNPKVSRCDGIQRQVPQSGNEANNVLIKRGIWWTGDMVQQSRASLSQEPGSVHSSQGGLKPSIILVLGDMASTSGLLENYELMHIGK